MVEITKNDVLNNYNLWSNSVLISNIKKPTNLNEISKILKVKKTSPYFYNLIRFLENNGFLVIDKSRVPHIIKVKSHDLSWFLVEGYIGELIKINFQNRMVGVTKVGYLGY